MSNEKHRWRCYECGVAENCDMSCTLETPTPDKPDYCPSTGDEAEWLAVSYLDGD